jgi:6,7-dimethyl-8-ribityllumazine synthase
VVPEEPALDVTGDEKRAQDLATDLREAEARLEAARAEAASLKVLLAVRTHQHDQTWQARERLAAERDAAGARMAALTAERDAAAAHAAGAVAEADERAEAVRTVLSAVLASIGARALDRRRFQDLIARAGREAPDHGPGAARHAVLLAEARRVLGIPSQGS